jgi:hypothetical protein
MDERLRRRHASAGDVDELAGLRSSILRSGEASTPTTGTHRSVGQEGLAGLTYRLRGT